MTKFKCLNLCFWLTISYNMQAKGMNMQKQETRHRNMRRLTLLLYIMSYGYSGVILRRPPFYP